MPYSPNHLLPRYRSSNKLDLSRRSVLLVGAGRLGRMIAWVIDRLVPDADLTIALRNPERKRQLPEDAAVKSLDEITRQYSVAIDCTGNANGFAVALDGLEAKGTLVVKSTYAEELQLDMSRIVVDEITVLGSRCGPMDKAVDFLEQYPEVFKTNNWVLALDDYKTAFHLARDSSIDKVLFQT